MSTDDLGLVAPDTRATRTVRWALGGVGVLVIGVGAGLLLLAAPTWPERISAGLWLLVPAVLNDLVLLPLGALAGWLVVRRVARPWRDVVLVALVLTLFALLLAVPFLTGYGRVADNPSLLDRDYAGGLAVVVAAVWLGCLGAGLVVARRGRPPRGRGAQEQEQEQEMVQDETGEGTR